jgi:hypothetical protein
MKRKRPLSPRTVVLAALCASGLLFPQCSLFEPRNPEDPSQQSLTFIPPTDHGIVISNLQNAIAQKSADNYLKCIADPSKTQRAFVFVPSAEAVSQYAGVLTNWTRDNEEAYFRNLVSRSPSNTFSNLFLSLKSSVVTADSVTYNYDYTLTFDHSDPGFPKTARGNMQFSLGIDSYNNWMIYRWSDYKTTSDVTWSLFKGKFSN